VPFDLELDWTCRPPSGLDEWSIRFTTSGELPLPAVPTVAMERIRVTHLTDQQAAVVADVVVHNPNDDPLNLVTLRYELKVAGYDMGTGTLPARRTIPGGGRMSLHLAGSRPVMGEAFGLGRRLTRAQVSYDLRGSGQVEVVLRMPWSFAANGTAPVVREDRP